MLVASSQDIINCLVLDCNDPEHFASLSKSVYIVV